MQLDVWAPVIYCCNGGMEDGMSKVVAYQEGHMSAKKGWHINVVLRWCGGRTAVCSNCIHKHSSKFQWPLVLWLTWFLEPEELRTLRSRNGPSVQSHDPSYLTTSHRNPVKGAAVPSQCSGEGPNAQGSQWGKGSSAGRQCDRGSEAWLHQRDSYIPLHFHWSLSNWAPVSLRDRFWQA